MMSYSPTIIVVAFSRPQALLRSLSAINDSYYRCDVKLIISIDGGGPKEVVEVAEEFNFQHGTKKVIARSRNIGLKNHILECGDLSEIDGSVIILEDDIVVDRFFYLYAQDALNYYSGFEEVGGISLYSPEFNEYAGLPFRPLLSEYDTYMMQVPSSWGQAWTFEQWSSFRQWEEKCDEGILQESDNIPDYVKKWKASSWKKYFALYLAEFEKYFVYPYISLTTNVSDPGGFHNNVGSNIVQVGIASQHRKYRAFYFALPGDNEIRYDPFMENCSKNFLRYIKERHDIEGEVSLDLYGLKTISNLKRYDYCVTSKQVNLALHQYFLDYRPHENNIVYNKAKNNQYSSLSLCKTQEVLGSQSTISGTTLIYWAGFNFLAKKYALINVKSMVKRLLLKL